MIGEAPTGDATEQSEPVIGGTTDETMLREDGQQYWLDIPDPARPGNTMRVASRTLSPAMLRMVRDGVHDGPSS